MYWDTAYIAHVPCSTTTFQLLLVYCLANQKKNNQNYKDCR